MLASTIDTHASGISGVAISQHFLAFLQTSRAFGDAPGTVLPGDARSGFSAGVLGGALVDDATEPITAQVTHAMGTMLSLSSPIAAARRIAY